MVLHPYLIFLAGLVIIILGAEMLLRGASRFAAILGLKPIVIGLTIVSVGTSVPELAVGITAVLEGRGALAVGNIAGTNIFNILFILGLSAMIRPLPIQLLSLKLDIPVMITVALVLVAMAWDGVLSPVEGGILFLSAIAYTVALVKLSRRETSSMKKEFEEEFSREATLPNVDLSSPRQRWLRGAWNFFLLAVGIALTLLGAELLVSGAVEIAKEYEVTDAIIGLTIVAIGTSAPEMATTVMATIKNDRDVAIGNLIGSSIYNVLVILGITCLASPGGVDISKDILWIDLPLAAAVAIVCYPVFKSDRMVSRQEGAFFFGAYIVYFATLLLFRT